MSKSTTLTSSEKEVVIYSDDIDAVDAVDRDILSYLEQLEAEYFNALVEQYEAEQEGRELLLEREIQQYQHPKHI